MSQTKKHDKFDKLLQEHPSFHGREEAGSKNYALRPGSLQWIMQNAKDGWHSLETGCGYSTICCALSSTKHITISPFPQEHQLIANWCRDNEIDTSHVQFIASSSQDVIHHLELSQLDLVLIDGDHAFPAPFIDWYYTADLLNPGGFVIVDDTNLTTGAILKDFLLAEEERWKPHTEFKNTSIFQKITDKPVAKGISWVHQPYCQKNDRPQSFLAKVVGKIYKAVS